jgi:hypothetical protein
VQLHRFWVEELGTRAAALGVKALAAPARFLFADQFYRLFHPQRLRGLDPACAGSPASGFVICDL